MRFGDLVLELGRQSVAVALNRLKAAEAQFAGTVHEGEVRARRALLEAEISRAAARPVVAEGAGKPAPPVAPAPAPDLLKALSKAEGLVGRRPSPRMLTSPIRLGAFFASWALKSGPDLPWP